MTTTYLIRFTKTLMVLFFGAYVAVVVFGNVTDYLPNFLFVRHVMSMETTFKPSSLMYRAVTTPALHHTAYIAIIVLEFFVALACLAGGFRMAKKLRVGPEEFHQSKALALAGLAGGLTLWFFMFQVIAGEWFAMWQSEHWNGLDAASRLTTYIGIALIALMQRED